MSIEVQELYGMTAREAADLKRRGGLPVKEHVRIVFDALNEMMEVKCPVLWLTEDGQATFALNVSPSEVECARVGAEWDAWINRMGEIFKHKPYE